MEETTGPLLQLGEERWRIAELLDALREVVLGLNRPEEAFALLREANRLRDQSFKILVVGEFSRGKSALLNALMGVDVLPKGIRPTTATVFRLSGASNRTAVATTSDGRKFEVPIEELSDFSVRRVEGAPPAEIEVRLPSPLLQAGVEFIDTPGVNDLAEQRSDITLQHLPEADALLFVLDAKHCFNETERGFLISNVMKANIERVFFVINKCDQLDPPFDAAAVRSLRERVRSIAEPLLEQPRIHAVSARSEVRNEAGGSRSGIGLLRADLIEFLRTERGTVTARRCVARANQIARELLESLDVRLRLLQASDAEELSRLEQLRRQIESLERKRSAKGSEWQQAATSATAVVRKRALAAARRAAQDVLAEAAVAEATDESAEAVQVALRLAFESVAAGAAEELRRALAEAAGQPRAQVVDLGRSLSVQVASLSEPAPTRTLGAEPLLTTRSALAGAGALGLAALLPAMTVGGAIFLGLCAFGVVRGVEASAEAWRTRVLGSARRATEQALDELDTRLGTLGAEYSTALWEEMAAPLRRRLSGLERALEAPGSDVGAERRAILEGMGEINALLSRLNLALGSLER